MKGFALQVHEASGKPLVLSTTRGEVQLWDASRLHQSPLLFPLSRSASFDPFARALATTHWRQASASIVDIATCTRLLTIEDEEGLCQ